MVRCKLSITIHMNKKQIIKATLGLTIGFTLLYFSMKGINYRELHIYFKIINWPFVLLGIFLYLGNFIIRSLRWKILLSIISEQNTLSVTKLILTGYAMNNILPARLGEVFRAYYTAKSLNLNFSQVALTIFIERFFDFILLFISFCFCGTFLVFYYPDKFEWISPIMLSTSIAVSIVFFLLLLRKKIFSIILSIFPKRLPKVIFEIESFVTSLNYRIYFKIIFLSIVILPIEIISVWCLLLALGISESVDFLILLQSASGLITLAPSAPGYIGSLQYSFRLVFESYGISLDLAILAATMLQIFYFGLITFIGLTILAFRKGTKIDHQDKIEQKQAK